MGASMTLDQHLAEIGVIAKPAPKPEVDRTKRGWVPAYPGDECPH